jgi:DNA polymerase-1
MANYWKLRGDDPMGVDYATGDGIATWSLRRAQVEDFEFQGMQRMHKLESDVTRVLYRMKKRGVRIDTEYLEYIKGYAEDKVAEGLKSLPEGFNARGPKQIKDLMTANGFTDWPMTAPSSKFPQGQPSFPEAWLDTNPVGKFIVNVRKWSNLLNSFIIPMRDRHIVNGRVHPTYHQMANDDFGTCTGRLSCSSPNLQQVPKRNKELAKLFRPIFIPDEGMEWLDADLSQCEPRLLAHYSGAKVLIDGFKAVPSVDAHEAVRLAVLDFGVQIDRESAKRVNQTLITGGGEGKIITMLGSRGKEIYDTYFEVMPEVKSFQRVAKERFRERKFLISLLGRRARLEFGSKDYLAMNRLLQCGNGDILKHSMVRIDALFEEDGDQCALLNNVHDSLSMQGAPEKRPVLMEALRIFTDYGPDRGTFLRVPMQADYGIGRNWGEATFPAEKASVG